MYDHNPEKVGRIAALWCATAGLALAMTLSVYLGLFEVVWPRYAPSLLIAIAVLLASAWRLGGWAGQLVLVRGWSGAGTGWLLGVLCLLLAVVAGSSINAFVEGEPMLYGWGSAFFDYIVKPLFWVMLVGGVAAVGPALLFAKLVALYTQSTQEPKGEASAL